MKSSGRDDHERPTVSVVIPVFEGGDAFRRCLAAIARSDEAPREILVVVDGGGDSDRRLAEHAGVRVLQTPTRGGPGRARNLGARAACGDVLLFLDADVTVHAGTVGQAVDALAWDPDVAAVFGSYDDTPGEHNFLSECRNLFHHYVHQTGREAASTFWAGCGAIRRSVFLCAGGFDERYRRASIEDVELGFRLTKAGYRVRLCKSLQVTHWKRWGFAAMVRADVLDRAIPWTWLILRQRGATNDLNLRQSHRLSVLMVFGLLGALLAVGLWDWPAAVAAALALGLLVLNADVYRFFWRKRGWWFALRAVAWHWTYYLYSGLGFAAGIATAFAQRALISTEKPQLAGPPSESV